MARKVFNRNDQKLKRKTLRHNMTLAEILLWENLRNKYQIAGFNFVRQYSVENFVIDFYCRKLKLAIEVDGKSHDSEEAFAKDKQRQSIIENYGINFIRFTNDEILTNMTSVLEKLGELVLPFSREGGSDS